MYKNKLFTIIFPSRGRIELTKQLLISLEKTTSNKKWIEVISICDQDDTDTLNLFQECSKLVTYDFKFICRKQKDVLDLPNDYYDLGLRMATDSYFTWIIGNDCEIVSQNWDIEFYDALNSTYPSIFNQIDSNELYFYFRINDDTHWNDTGKLVDWKNDDSCCFPIISSNYCKDLGEFYPIEIPTWGGDTCLYHLFTKSNVTKILDATELIEIMHHSMHNKRVAQDDISKRVEDRHLSNKIDGADPWSIHQNTVDILNKRRKFLWK